jgi:hypothetical protein
VCVCVLAARVHGAAVHSPFPGDVRVSGLGWPGQRTSTPSLTAVARGACAQALEALRRGTLQYGLDRSEMIRSSMGRSSKHGVEEVTSVAFQLLRSLLPQVS